MNQRETPPQNSAHVNPNPSPNTVITNTSDVQRTPFYEPSSAENNVVASPLAPATPPNLAPSDFLANIPNAIICRGNLPKNAVDELKNWLFEHFQYPYPTEAEKELLMAKTSLTLTQVNNWFINARRRIWRPIVEKKHQQQQQQTTPSSMQSPPSHQLQKSLLPSPSSNLRPNASPMYSAPQHLSHHSNSSDDSFSTTPPPTITKEIRNFTRLTIENHYAVDDETPPASSNRKRTYQDMLIEDNYPAMLEEYNRLLKENEQLKLQLTKLNANYKLLHSDLYARRDALQKRLQEMQEMQKKLESSNMEMMKKMRLSGGGSIAKPVASRSNSIALSQTETSAFEAIEPSE